MEKEHLRGILKKIYDKKEYIIIGLLIFISVLVLFRNLGSSTLNDWDESWYAENALEILKTHDWSVMRYGGNIDYYYGKGPLGAWLVALSFIIFGVNEFALRFFPAFFGVLTVVLLYLFGKEISGRKTGVIAAVLLLINKGYIGYHCAGTGDFDSMMIFFMILTLYLFYISEKYDKKLLIIPMFFVIALNFMVKTVLAFLPLFTILLYLLITRKLRSYKNKYSLYGIITFLIVTLPGLILYFIVDKKNFYHTLFYHTLTRFTETFFFEAPWYYYIGIILGHVRMFFFIIFLISVIYSLYLIKKKNHKNLLIFLYIFFAFTVFSVSRTKLFWYIFPLYPAISLLSADFITAIKIKPKTLRMIAVILFIILITFCLLDSFNFKNIINKDKNALVVIKNQDFFKGINTTIYYHDIFNNDSKPSVYFYLSKNYNGFVKHYYGDIQELSINKGDYIVTFQKDRIEYLKNDSNYTLALEDEDMNVFRKN